MKLRIRAAMLGLLVMAAAYTAAEAWRSLRPGRGELPPEEMIAALYGGEGEAEYYLKSCDGFVAVYPNVRARTPERITAIETASLRGADRALLERGIPVADTETLLVLLEDLGS